MTEQRITVDLPKLMAASLNGDEQSAEELDKCIRPRLNKFFARRGVDESNVDDMTQETMMIMINKFNGNILGDKQDVTGAFLTWIYKIGNYKFFNYCKKSKRERSSINFEYDLDTVPNKDEVHYQDERLEELQNQFLAEIAKFLTSNQKSIVEMFMQGLNLDQICQKAGKTERSIESLVYRARKKIEQNLFIPAGYKPLADFHDSRLHQAAFAKRLPAPKFLGEYYCNDEIVRRYQYKAERRNK